MTRLRRAPRPIPVHLLVRRDGVRDVDQQPAVRHAASPRGPQSGDIPARCGLEAIPWTLTLGARCVPHPVSWTHVCATRHGVARIPRALRAACDTPASLALVVAFDELGDGRAHVGEMSKDPTVDGLLLERAIPALDDPVGFGLFNEGEAGVDAPVTELVESAGFPPPAAKVATRPRLGLSIPSSHCQDW